MKTLLLFPCNGNAREALSVIEAINAVEPRWQVLGFIDDDPGKQGKTFSASKVLGGREVLDQYPDAQVLAVPGRPENYHRRQEMIDSLNIPLERFASILHPTAAVASDCKVGRNCLLMHNVVLTSSVTLGNHVVILPNTVLSHDVTVADYSMIGSNVTISGSVRLDRNCYIGSGARLIQEIHIGAQALIGIGSVVINDVKPATVVAGNPARTLRNLP